MAARAATAARARKELRDASDGRGTSKLLSIVPETGEAGGSVSGAGLTSRALTAGASHESGSHEAPQSHRRSYASGNSVRPRRFPLLELNLVPN